LIQCITSYPWHAAALHFLGNSKFVIGEGTILIHNVLVLQ
jgi:hypothetical protein